MTNKFAEQKIYADSNMFKFFLIFLTIATLKTQAQNRSLAYYLDSAVQKSPLIADLNNQQLLNTLDSLQIIAANKYQVNGTGSAIYAPVIHGYGYDEAISNGGNYTALVIVSKPFISKQNLGLQFNALRFISDSIRLNSKLAEADIIRNIATQYITAYGNQLILHFNEDITSVLKKEEVLLKKLTEQKEFEHIAIGVYLLFSKLIGQLFL